MVYIFYGNTRRNCICMSKNMDYVFRKNAWDGIETVLGWLIAAVFWGVVLLIAAVNFIFLGGWLSITPGNTKEVGYERH